MLSAIGAVWKRRTLDSGSSVTVSNFSSATAGLNGKIYE